MSTAAVLKPQCLARAAMRPTPLKNSRTWYGCASCFGRSSHHVHSTSITTTLEMRGGWHKSCNKPHACTSMQTFDLTIGKTLRYMNLDEKLLEHQMQWVFAQGHRIGQVSWRRGTCKGVYKNYIPKGFALSQYPFTIPILAINSRVMAQ